MGILNRTPDSFYDKGATFALDDLVRRAGDPRRRGCRPARRRRGQGRPRPRGGGGRGAGPGRPGHRGPGRPVRRRPVGGHLARLGGPRGLRGPARWWATTSAGSPTPTTCPPPPPPGPRVVATHIRLGPRIPDPDPVYDDVVETVATFLAERAGRALAARAPPRPDRRSTPASISARRPPSRWPCCGPRTGWPTSATRCSCRRPTRRSSACVLGLEIGRASRGVAGRHRARGGPRLSDRCGSTTWAPTARPATCWPPWPERRAR